MSEVRRLQDRHLDPAAFARAYLDHVSGVLERVDAASVAAVVQALDDARRRGATIYLLGNGGSAALASHLASDLQGLPGAPAVRAWCLADSVAAVTARANDHGYAQVFSRQLEGRVAAGDVVVAISSSGASENVLCAVDLARAAGATTIGLSGFAGAPLAARCDLSISLGAAAGDYGPVEGVHAVLCHLLANGLAARHRTGP